MAPSPSISRGWRFRGKVTSSILCGSVSCPCLSVKSGECTHYAILYQLGIILNKKEMCMCISPQVALGFVAKSYAPLQLQFYLFVGHFWSW
jgi:hypothetical protein